ncbi:hypothetical protein [uncultured Tateyamaria sp.]|uniref:hypothetical protein n=1 Tax=uncultured Tateyamaria sp. TaxID=455651 RepID=UPI00262E4162|nr:hypothetical protein [uncultured Tateyamaria sp.]
MMTEQLTPELQEKYENFPSYMLTAPDVFKFEHMRSTAAAMKLRNHADLSDLLQRTLKDIEASDLPEDAKSELREMIAEEEVVVSFSQISRRCIVTL